MMSKTRLLECQIFLRQQGRLALVRDGSSIRLPEINLFEGGARAIEHEFLSKAGMRVKVAKIVPGIDDDVVYAIVDFIELVNWNETSHFWSRLKWADLRTILDQSIGLIPKHWDLSSYYMDGVRKCFVDLMPETA